MKDKAVVVLVDEKLPTVKLATFFDVKSRSIRVELAAMVQFGEETPQPLRARDTLQMTNQMLAQQRQLEFGVKAIKDKQQQKFVESQIATIGPVVEKLQNLVHSNQAIHNTGKVHFRIFSIVDDQEIELFRTKTP